MTWYASSWQHLHQAYQQAKVSSGSVASNEEGNH